MAKKSGISMDELLKYRVTARPRTAAPPSAMRRATSKKSSAKAALRNRATRYLEILKRGPKRSTPILAMIGYHEISRPALGNAAKDSTRVELKQNALCISRPARPVFFTESPGGPHIIGMVPPSAPLPQGPPATRPIGDNGKIHHVDVPMDATRRAFIQGPLITAIVVDVHRIFVFWSLHWQAVVRGLPAIKIINLSDKTISPRVIVVNIAEGSMFLDVAPGGRYVIELGIADHAGRFVSVSRSDRIKIPGSRAAKGASLMPQGHFMFTPGKSGTSR